jgi:ubiquinone/menaquinone biosynthesis C-methylase UbiE
MRTDGRQFAVPTSLDEATVHAFYDRLGARHDWLEFIESRAKAAAILQLDLRRGQRVLNAGCGTGKNHRQLSQTVGPTGLAVGLDLSTVMAVLTHSRTGAPVCRARVSQLPFESEAFDRLFCTFVLDVLPAEALGKAVVEFHRVLRAGGRAVVASLGLGLRPPEAWVGRCLQWLSRRAPLALGGCRPLRLNTIFREAGFRQIMWEPISQLGVPCELVIAQR